jgi:hypothetical protein
MGNVPAPEQMPEHDADEERQAGLRADAERLAPNPDYMTEIRAIREELDALGACEAHRPILEGLELPRRFWATAMPPRGSQTASPHSAAASTARIWTRCGPTSLPPVHPRLSAQLPSANLAAQRLGARLRNVPKMSREVIDRMSSSTRSTESRAQTA